MHVWALGLSCETPAAPPDRAAGARTRQPENSKRAHLSARALQTPPKFHERPTREGEKNEKLWREREKKARNFGPPPFGAPTFRGPTLRAPTFSRFGPPTLRGPTLRGPTLRGHTLRPTLRGPTLRGHTLRGHTLGGSSLQAPPGSTLRGHTLGGSPFGLKNRKINTKLAKVGLAKVGHPNFGQSRSIKVGQSRSKFFGQSRFGQSRIGQSRSNKDGQSRFGQSRSQPRSHANSSQVWRRPKQGVSRKS